jgi:prepilin-type N-terminal cleavage/methylation domain-containing protein
VNTNLNPNRTIRANSRNSRIEPGRSLSANYANFREAKLPTPIQRFNDSTIHAFTLLELLVVIGIIALIAAIAVPAMNGMRPNLLAVASRQMLDDLNWARQRAISDHTTVYVVFVPSCADNLGTQPGGVPGGDIQRFLQGQYTSYAFYVKRQLGDQPGNPTVQYLTGWKKLPLGTAFAREKFGYPVPGVIYNANTVPYVVTVSGTNVCWTFDVTSVQWDPDLNPQPGQPTGFLPYISFDYRGSLSSSWHTDGAKAGHCVIPLTKAIVSAPHDPTDPTHQALLWQGAPALSFSENPVGGWIDPTLYTYIVIDGPTGKAHVEHALVK